MTTGVYEILNKSDNKRYIGSSIIVENRKAQHFAYLRGNYHPNRHLQSAFNKYGEENFEFTIIEQCDEAVILDREEYYIGVFNVLDDRYGYNLAPEPYAGSRGFKWTQRSKDKLSNTLISQYATKLRKPAKYKQSQEAKKRISEALILQHSNGTRVASNLRQSASARNKIALGLRKPIYCPQTETYYLSITAASEILDIASSYIYRVLSGELKSAKGYMFEYAKKPPQKEKE